ncbi:MAG: flagellar hook-basal body complex protein FliE [Planctomycetes bacterium]|nr:flagellar hook-basal body complex protein FliE [Planctomycetota bacterium]
MPGMIPISSVGAATGPSSIAGSQTLRRAPEKSNFSDMLKAYVNKVDQSQQGAGAAIGDLVSGKTDDILPTVIAVADADMSFKLLIGVRNKVIDAYRQTMNMQV